MMMSRDLFVLIAFCVFIFLLAMRMWQRFADRQKRKQESPEEKISVPEPEATQAPPEVKAKIMRRGKRIRILTIIQLVVLGGLMAFMTPALFRDFADPGRGDTMSLVLRCLIFISTIYVFILGCLEIFGRKGRDNRQE